MKIVIFGLSVSSSWGNGHASLWRGLIGALVGSGHEVVFFERDVPYYADNRDLHALPEGGTLVLYRSLSDTMPLIRRELDGADVAMVTSYCPDALDALDAIVDARVGVRCFYDLDTPVTLGRLAAGEIVSYVGPSGLRDYDLVLSYTGGAALEALHERLGARLTVPIYGSVDPALHCRAAARPAFAGLLSYIGTYAEDRQDMLSRLLLEPAQALPHERFIIAGSQYPAEFPWSPNVVCVEHLAPPEHAAFYSSCKMTLNVTRRAMAAMGWCPSGRLFEAAACGAPILSDWFAGLDEFFSLGEEIVVVHDAEQALAALRLGSGELGAMARRARERTLDEHTASRRAKQMIAAFERASQAPA